MNAHTHDLSPWQHSHVFDSGNRRGELRTRAVLVVTLITMVAEIAGGWWTGSMALLADGWHMASHHSGPVPSVATERATPGASAIPARDRRRLH